MSEEKDYTPESYHQGEGKFKTIEASAYNHNIRLEESGASTVVKISEMGNTIILKPDLQTLLLLRFVLNKWYTEFRK